MDGWMDGWMDTGGLDGGTKRRAACGNLSEFICKSFFCLCVLKNRIIWSRPAAHLPFTLTPLFLMDTGQESARYMRDRGRETEREMASCTLQAKVA
jgi:hypothetical protein